MGKAGSYDGPYADGRSRYVQYLSERRTAAAMTDRVAFLLGAGASTEAGVPTMRGLVDLFSASVAKGKDESELLTFLRERLAARDPKGVVDVELLLASLQRAYELDDDPAAVLLDLRTGMSIDPEVARSLAEKLKDFLRLSCSTPIDLASVEHLVPLAMFARSQGDLDILTLNYDCSVEAVADREGVRLVDGFRFFWSPEEEFDSEHTPGKPLIRLYKLHGSVSWYRRATYEWVKLPVRPPETVGLLYFTGEPLTEVMVYPAVQKDIGSTPLTDLMLRAQHALKEASVIVIVGYSLRDERIRESLYEAMARSRRAQIVLVDPQAESLANEWLADPGIRSRTLPLDLTAGAALGANFLYKTVAAILSAQQRADDAEAQKPQLYGQARRVYKEAIRSYYDIRHIDAVRSIVEREEATNPEPVATSDQHPLPMLSSCAAFALLAGTDRPAWWRLLVPLLYWLEVDRLRIQVTPAINARPGRPDLVSVSATFGFVEDDVSAMQSLFKTFMATTHTGQTSMFGAQLQRLIRQVDRLGTLGGLQYAPEPGRTADLTKMAPEYVAESSPSELAATLSVTPTIAVPDNLRIDWAGPWPIIQASAAVPV
jgi:hypothetical protein